PFPREGVSRQATLSHTAPHSTPIFEKCPDCERQLLKKICFFIQNLCNFSHVLSSSVIPSHFYAVSCYFRRNMICLVIRVRLRPPHFQIIWRPRHIMMAQLIDRKQLKQEMKELLRSAQVSPRGMTCLYLALVLVLNLADSFMGLMNPGLLGTFISILTGLMSMVLASGFVMYCMAIRRGERAEYLTLFDGFSFVGKVILLNIVIYLFTFFWSLLFVIPGIIAAYRYRFALYNLYENPGIGVMEALNMSKQQTLGYKGQLFMLDLSYIGWLLLASLTSVVQTGYIYACIFQD
ncbi:Inner membrane ABC transporter permease protein ycjO, partial [Dysosmobacter welbionis]